MATTTQDDHEAVTRFATAAMPWAAHTASCTTVKTCAEASVARLKRQSPNKPRSKDRKHWPEDAGRMRGSTEQPCSPRSLILLPRELPVLQLSRFCSVLLRLLVFIVAISRRVDYAHCMTPV